MKTLSASALALLSVLALACDSVEEDALLRDLDDFAPPATATARFGDAGEALRVIDYGLGANLDAAIDDPASVLRQGATLDVDADALLRFDVDGLGALGHLDDDATSFTLGSGAEALAFEGRAERVTIRMGPDGHATTELVVADDGQAGSPDDLTWVDDEPPAIDPAPAVTEIRYELVSTSGRRTTCSTRDFAGAERMDFTRLPDGQSVVEIDIADACFDILEAAAAAGKNDAFFVSCAATTVTASAVVRVSNVTLKRGVFSGVGTVSTGVLVH